MVEERVDRLIRIDSSVRCELLCLYHESWRGRAELNWVEGDVLIDSRFLRGDSVILVLLS